MEHLDLKFNKVLVVEDNNINQLVVKYTLQKIGIEIEVAEDGKQAIEKLSEGNYDLILMDIQLPIMNGYEVARHIRNQMNNPIPIIAMTALAINGEDEKCLESGMNGYITKPFTVESLHRAITNVFKSTTMASVNPDILSNPDVTIDMSMLYEVAVDDQEYIRIMVSTFLENMPSTINKIEDCLKAKDYDSLYRAAHYAKSSLSVIKIDELLGWVERIEHNAKKRVDLNTLDLLVEKVKAKYKIAEKLLIEKFGAIV